MRTALLLAVIAFGLAGCAHYHAQRTDLVDQVEVWIAEQKYQQALDAMRLVEQDHPDYRRIRAKERAVMSLVQAFEQGIILQARKQAEREQWHAAYRTYQRGLERLPDSIPIREAQQRFVERRDARMDALRAQTTLNEGRGLLRNLRLYADILDTAPNDRRARFDQRDAQRRARQTASDLRAFAERAVGHGHYSRAGEYLALARELAASDPHLQEDIEAVAQTRAEGLRELEQQQARARAQRMAREAEQREARMDRLLRQYRRAVAADDLIAAKETLVEAAQLRPEDEEIGKLQTSLETSIRLRVKHGTEHGRQLYSQGKVQEALSIWSGLLELAPEDAALQAHIERAERVLSKLERLSQQPSPIPLSTQ